MCHSCLYILSPPQLSLPLFVPTQMSLEFPVHFAIARSSCNVSNSIQSKFLEMVPRAAPYQEISVSLIAKPSGIPCLSIHISSAFNSYQNDLRISSRAQALYTSLILLSPSSFPALN